MYVGHSERPGLRTALLKYDARDIVADSGLDRIVQITALLFKVPVALITLSNAGRVWLKAAVGVELTSLPKEVAFCDHMVRTRCTLVVPDPRDDPRFVDSPYAKGPMGKRARMGCEILARTLSSKTPRGRTSV